MHRCSMQGIIEGLLEKAQWEMAFLSIGSRVSSLVFGPAFIEGSELPCYYRKPFSVSDIESNVIINREIPMTKKLYRSRKNRLIAGICGGLAEYFDIDTIIVRLITLIFVLSFGAGLMAYIIAWIVVPEEPDNLYPDSTEIRVE
jgi:phage shock protein C